jgi:hypothetical protein
VTLRAGDFGSMNAHWFDPRTGALHPIGRTAGEGVRRFDPPGTPGRGNDWVLALKRRG